MYSRTLSILALAAAVGCGDNLDGPSDAGPGGDGGGEVCTRELATSKLDGGSYDTRFTVQGFTGFDGHAPTVYDFALDTDGSIVVAGEFSYLGSDHVEPLLRWKNGAWGPARTTWEIEPPGSGFAAVAIDASGRLALATYDDFGERSGQIWLDDGTGLRVIGEFDGLIRRLAWYDGELWAAGLAQIETTTTPVPNLAVWNGSGWTPPPGGAVDGPVFTLVHDGNALLVGGGFTEIGGAARASVASYNGTAWTALNFPNVTIYALARDANNQLYAGGTFGDLFGATGGIAHWTGTAWELAAGGLANGGIVGVVTDLAQHDGSLYASGCFTNAGGDAKSPTSVASRDIVRFDGAWHAVDDGSKLVLSPWVEPRMCGDEGPESVWDASKQRLFSAGTRLFVGGSFPGMGGVMSQAIIGLDGTTWTAQGPAGLGLGGQLERVAASDSCEVYGLSQQLTHVAGAPSRSRVLHFTGTAWEAIADTLNRDDFCVGFAVSPAGEVAVGCMVEGGGRVFRVAGSSLEQLGGDVPFVQALAYDPDGTLWVGGNTDTGAGFLARLDGSTFTIVEDGFDAAVQVIDPVSSTDVIVGGSFAKVGELDVARIARWDGSTWSALGGGLPSFMVSAIAHDGSKVYASSLDFVEGAYLLGAFDGTTWTELATPASGLTAQASYNFNAIRVVGDALVVGGTAQLDDGSGRGVLVYQNGRFRPLGGGVHATNISDLAITSDAIWVAGGIAEAGPESAPISTVGVARYAIE